MYRTAHAQPIRKSTNSTQILLPCQSILNHQQSYGKCHSQFFQEIVTRQRSAHKVSNRIGFCQDHSVPCVIIVLVYT